RRGRPSERPLGRRPADPCSHAATGGRRALTAAQCPRPPDNRVAPGCLTSRMRVEGDYEPSPRSWVRDQVELYEDSGGTQGTTLRDTGLPVVIISNRGVRSGKLRKTPVMRVEHDGRYAAIASQGGAPAHPRWYYNLRADPSVELQD